MFGRADYRQMPWDCCYTLIRIRMGDLHLLQGLHLRTMVKRKVLSEELVENIAMDLAHLDFQLKW